MNLTKSDLTKPRRAKVYKLTLNKDTFIKQRVLLANGNQFHIASRVDLTCLL